MSNSNPISGIGSFGAYSPVDSMAYQQRIIARQGQLTDNCLCPIAQPSMDQIAMLQGYYNSCLGSIEQLRYGCSFPQLMPTMSQNPQMMLMFMMYQQMQMQNMMLMMLLMQGNGLSSQALLPYLNSRGSNQGGGGCSGNLPVPSGGSCASADKQQINQLLDNAAQKYGIPPNILKAIAWQESRWNPGAVGDGGKSFGMMQIYTSAHPDYDVQKGKADIQYNIEYGARLLRSLYDKYGSWEKAVERYNGSGPMAVRYSGSVMSKASSQPWLA